VRRWSYCFVKFSTSEIVPEFLAVFFEETFASRPKPLSSPAHEVASNSLIRQTAVSFADNFCAMNQRVAMYKQVAIPLIGVSAHKQS